MKKWVSTVKNHTIVKVAMSKKREGRLEKSDEKNIDFLPKNRGKIDEKVGCSALLSKNRENHCPGTQIFPQNRIFGKFGGPLGTQKLSPRDE